MYPKQEKTRTPAVKQVQVLTMQVITASLEKKLEKFEFRVLWLRRLMTVGVKEGVEVGVHKVQIDANLKQLWLNRL